MKAPAFQFYARDWLAPGDVRRMSVEARGCYIDLLAYAWDKGGIPPQDIEDPTMLARLVGVSARKFRSLWKQVQHKFATDSRGFHVNNRLEEEREHLSSFSRTQSEKALKRWNSPTKSSEASMPVHMPDSDAGQCSASASASADPPIVPPKDPAPTLKLDLTPPPSRDSGEPPDPELPEEVRDLGQPKNGKVLKLVLRHHRKAREVLAALNQARERVNSRCGGVRASFKTLEHICQRLAEGTSVEACCSVISIGEAESKRNPETFTWLNPITLFGDKVFEIKLAQVPRQSKKNGMFEEFMRREQEAQKR